MLGFPANRCGFFGVTEIICFPYTPPDGSPSGQIAQKSQPKYRVGIREMMESREKGFSDTP